MILCDIGNTTYHFMTHDESFKVGINKSLENLDLKKNIYYISVNEDGEKKLLEHYPNAVDLKNKIDLDSNYANSLGIDRAIACMGITDGIIVDFGSAITVDIMQHNKHIGGFILPGVEKLISLYPQISPKLNFEYQEKIPLSLLPTNTNNAISFGINSMIVESIRSIYHSFNLPLIITGEHGVKFLHYFENVMYEPKLIFKNMQLIIEQQGI